MLNDQRASARLLLGSQVAPSLADDPRVIAAVRSRPVRAMPWRGFQRLAMKRGRLSYLEQVVKPLVAARRATLGQDAAAPPRFLVRVDEFPYYLAYDDPVGHGLEVSRRLHAILAEAGVPYLISVVPRLTHRPMDPHATGGRDLNDAEVAFLEEQRQAGVCFAQHGDTHRTRARSPRRQSELCGLGPDALSALLERGRRTLGELGIRPRVFVPPFNRFDASQYAALAGRYDVVCGGPESVARLGFHRTPLWRGDAVYLPAYPPFYGSAATVLPGAERLIQSSVGLWVPVVLHTAWEAREGWEGLRRLAARLAPHAASWDDFLAEAHESRQGT